MLASGVLASNIPDFDFIAGFSGGDRRLLYLLEHRGFTHTLIVAVALGAIVGWLCALALRLAATRDRLAVCALGSAACVLHVACDLLNDYGVHPLFPFDNHWYYGDSVFIIEPLWLAVMLPLPALFAGSRTGRVLARTLALALLALCWFVLPAGRAAAVSVVQLIAAAFQWKLGPRALPALGASCAVIAMFALGSRLAESRVRLALGSAAPAERVLDVASSPTPADPTCHRALVVSVDSAEIYRVRLARIQLFGSAASCQLLPGQPTAPLTAARLASSEGVAFDSMFAAPASQLRALSRERCDAAAMLRFLRVPFWLEQASGTVLGDLRYDRAPQLEFAERALTGDCADVGQWRPWVPPREDILGYFGAQNGLMPGTPSTDRSKHR